MEMAGIVCLTGATIIQLARSRVEQIGRPLELDTDGIWCILPEAFPEDFKLKTVDGKSISISYPCVMLNHLVHAQFTNHQYQELKVTEDGTKTYETHSENSIFFEVDGPYRAMILPSSTEEDKLLKKRYAVFNHDGSLAELKGFEVKRRGELKLIKIFQEAIFKVFLQGTTLEECYGTVAGVADQWLDVLFSKGADLSDEELIELISENRSMSKSLEEYGTQKSTSISTARRLAEFLGDNMVKDKGLACKFIISERPHGVPVSERAIPVSIFHAEESIKRHFLRKWLRDSGLVDLDIRSIIDWKYYLERFGSVIQKIITIPAAMQGVRNPVPRVKHPDWLRKRVAAHEDKFKQHRITDMFKKLEPGQTVFASLDELDDDDDALLNGHPLNDQENMDTSEGRSAAKSVIDLEDIVSDTGRAGVNIHKGRVVPIVHKRSSKRTKLADEEDDEDLGDMPDPEVDYRAWLAYQKRKWKRQRAEKAQDVSEGLRGLRAPRGGVGTFFRQQIKSILQYPWEVLQIIETDLPGEFRLWALIDGAMHSIKLEIPRVFYLNSRVSQPEDFDGSRKGFTMTRKHRALPRSHISLNLYELVMSEAVYRQNFETFAKLFNHQDIEGVYETQVPLLFRGLMNLGCAAGVTEARVKSGKGLDSAFHIDDLKHLSTDKVPYLRTNTLKYLYLFHAGRGSRHIYGVFSSVSDKVYVFFVDPARNRGGVPPLSRVYAERRQERLDKLGDGPTQYHNPATQTQVSPSLEAFTYSEDLGFSFSVHATDAEALIAINQVFREHQEARRGPTMVIVQSPKTPRQLREGGIRLLEDFPTLTTPSHKKDNSFPALGWQQSSARRMMAHFLNVNGWLNERIEIARYADVPVGNFENDYPLFLTDLLFARRLNRNDMILWYSHSNKPDLGGREQVSNSE
jgi:DNA polymerase epsilon subunit 1